MSYRLGKRSCERLEPAHPDLKAVIEHAITQTTVDFTVGEVLRSQKRQRVLFNKGASQTMNSRHLVHKDGLVYAADLFAWVEGSVSWEWPFYYDIARAMQHSSRWLKIPIRWGGCWQLLTDIGDPEIAVEEYAAKKRRQQQKAFTDGPHFELPTKLYPGSR